MRRFVLIAILSLVGCSRENPVGLAPAETCPAVSEAIRLISQLERRHPSKGETFVRSVSVKGMSAHDFKRILLSVPGREVHVWMPGENDWVLVGSEGTNAVSLASVMETFAADTNCTTSVAEIFASYAGTREDILPAFESDLRGEVVPQWFVTREIPAMDWLDATGVEEDIRPVVLSEIRSMQVVRRLLLEGNMLAEKAKDKKGEESAIDLWARVALRNPNDPMLQERLWNLNRNAKGFLEVGKLLQALKCYETLVLVRPNDAVAINNFGVCLKKIGKLDMAEKVLERAKKLQQGLEAKTP